jgi:hypothetical protein
MKHAVTVLASMLAACAATGPSEPEPENPEGLEVPFVVSNYFAPSGFMGDGASMGIVAETTPEACLPRPEGAEGDCYRFTYTAKDQLWGGVYWQFPADNWGSSEGKKVQPGATRVRFYAASGTPGQVITITVGGVNDVTLPNHDTLRVQQQLTLTSELTMYELDITGQVFDRIIGAFAWSAAYPAETDPAAAAPIVLYFDDIVYE